MGDGSARGLRLYEAYDARLTRQEAAWLLSVGRTQLGLAVIALASVPVLWLTGTLWGLGWSLAVFAMLLVIYSGGLILWFRLYRRLVESLAERHGLTAKAARRIEFRRGLDGFDRSLVEARRRSASGLDGSDTS